MGAGINKMLLVQSQALYLGDRGLASRTCGERRVSPHVHKALPCDKMASRCGEESGATAFCSESSREGTNILVVKGTTHTGMKDICTKATMITLASLGVGQFKKPLRKN